MLSNVSLARKHGKGTVECGAAGRRAGSSLGHRDASARGTRRFYEPSPFLLFRELSLAEGRQGQAPLQRL